MMDSEVEKKIKEAKFHIEFIKSRLDKIVEMSGSKMIKKEIEAVKDLLGETYDF